MARSTVLGSVYNSQGDYHKAIQVPLTGSRHSETSSGRTPPSRCEQGDHTHNNLWGCGIQQSWLGVYSQGDYHKAIKFHSQALDIQKQVLGEHHPDVATSYNNLGSVYIVRETTTRRSSSTHRL